MPRTSRPATALAPHWHGDHDLEMKDEYVCSSNEVRITDNCL